MFENTDKKVQESSTNYYCEKCNQSYELIGNNDLYPSN